MLRCHGRRERSAAARTAAVAPAPAPVQRDMHTSTAKNVTQMLYRVAGGDSAAADELFEAVYGELHAIAGRCFRGERADHTLQPTALVHEAYLKLVRQDGVRWNDRVHFFAVAARAMRQILVNHALARKRLKRGGDRRRTPLSLVAEELSQQTIDLLALDEALGKLEQRDPRMHQVVELRFFSGLTNSEVAELLGVSLRTIEGDWSMARAWLLREIDGAGEDERGAMGAD